MLFIYRSYTSNSANQLARDRNTLRKTVRTANWNWNRTVSK